jgi:N-acetylmuramoyl-L-alanine amidase
MPSALFENLFIDNDNEAKLLADPVFINKLANEYAYAFSIALDLKRK